MKCLRIYADAQGESHFEDIDIPGIDLRTKIAGNV